MTLLRTLHTLSSKNFLAGAAILRAQRCDRLHGKQAQQFFASDVQRRCMSTSSSKKQSHCDEKSSSKMLVYLGSIRSTVKMVKSLSLTSSFLGILAQPILLQKLSGSSVGATVIVVSCASFFIFVTPLMLHYVTRRYVTELTYDPGTKEFNATTLTLLNRKKEMSFIADDVEVPTVPGPFTTLLAKGRPLFVEVQNFQNADALEHLLGYDKPIDLKMKPSHAPEPEQVLTKQKSTQGS